MVEVFQHSSGLYDAKAAPRGFLMDWGLAKEHAPMYVCETNPTGRGWRMWVQNPASAEQNQGLLGPIGAFSAEVEVNFRRSVPAVRSVGGSGFVCGNTMASVLHISRHASHEGPVSFAVSVREMRVAKMAPCPVEYRYSQLVNGHCRFLTCAPSLSKSALNGRGTAQKDVSLG